MVGYQLYDSKLVQEQQQVPRLLLADMKSAAKHHENIGKSYHSASAGLRKLFKSVDKDCVQPAVSPYSP